jgi:hypothetical protein
MICNSILQIHYPHRTNSPILRRERSPVGLRASFTSIMLTAARSISAALRDSPAAPLLSRLEHMQALQQALGPSLAQIAPSLDLARAGAVELREATLILNTSSAAQAAKLRHAVPGILRFLHQRGAQVNHIQVRVQPTLSSERDGGTAPADGSLHANARESKVYASDNLQAALMAAEKLTLTISESPLRDAANRLLATLQRQLARSR